MARRRRSLAETIEAAAPPGFEHLSVRPEGLRLAHFSRSLLRGTVGQHAGEPFELEPWQVLIASELLSGRLDGRPRYGEALIGLPRGNGKTGFGAVLAWEGLLVEGIVDPGAEIYCAASTRDQARILFNDVRRMREASPLLMDWTRAYRDAIEVPETGAILRVLAGDRAGEAAHGLRPSRTLVDEVHAHRDPELYYALRTASHKRPGSLLAGISTAGHDLESLCGELYRKGREGNDPRFFFLWLGLTDEEVEEIGRHPERAGQVAKRVNPASFVTAEALQGLYRGVPFGVFLRLHGNRWTQAENLWLPAGAWDACRGDVAIRDGDPVWMAVDPGFTHDTCGTVEVAPVYDRDDGQPSFHVRARAFGVRPDPKSPPPPVHDILDGDEVDYDVVESHVRDVARRQRLRAAAYDPFRFWRSAQILGNEGLPMVEFPQTNERMCPASQTLFDLIVERRIVHDGDPHLAAQIGNATARDTGRGWRLDKKPNRRGERDRRDRPPMDLAVALAMGVSLAAAGTSKPRPRFSVLV
jgi:phage terminase large subunit-like protein